MIGAQTIAGTTRLETCSLHGRQFPQTFFPSVQGQESFWAGCCPDCEEDRRLEQRADELLAARPGERWKRLNAALAANEKAIQRETDARMAAEREERRSEWETLVRDEYTERLTAQVEREMRAEIVSSLKTQEPSASAAGR